MILRPFEYVESKTVEDAVAALKGGGEEARIIAGGTALVPLMKHSVLRPSLLVSIARVPGLADIAPAESGGLRIGGVSTHWAVSHATLVQERSPLLAYACSRVASPTVRSMGTLGGNLCYGESASDPSPALLALRASVRLQGPGGARIVPITEFFSGFYETALREAEVLMSIDVPAMPANARWRYLKWTPRAQEDKALVGLAAMLVLDGRRCRVARLAVGGVGASPMVLARAEQVLEGQELDEATIARAADAAAGEAEPMDDLQGSAEYRRDMLRVWVRRVVGGLVEGESVVVPVLTLTVNERAVRVEIAGHWTLIQLLRDGLGLLGTKEGCGEGSCGACTVLVDGRLTRACLALAVRADGARVTTIEGVGTDAALHPIQDAFVRHGAIQCGFCTPGLVITTKALLDEHPRPTDHEIREFLSGNFCRCAGYNLILDAVRAAAGLPTEKR